MQFSIKKSEMAIFVGSTYTAVTKISTANTKATKFITMNISYEAE